MQIHKPKKKCAMKMKHTSKKNDMHVKNLLMEEGVDRACVPWISTSFKSMIVDRMKVLFV